MQSVLITGELHRPDLVHAWRSARSADRLVVIRAMTYAPSFPNPEPLIAARNIVFIKGDIPGDCLMRRLLDEHSFTRVAHLATKFQVDRSIADSEAFVQTDMLGTFTLLRPRSTAGTPLRRTARASCTSRQVGSMARSALPILRSPKARLVRTRPMPPVRHQRIIWCTRSSDPTGYRRRAPIAPAITEQWYLDREIGSAT
jgi:hypothetical protein